MHKILPKDVVSKNGTHCLIANFRSFLARSYTDGSLRLLQQLKTVATIKRLTSNTKALRNYAFQVKNFFDCHLSELHGFGIK